VALEQLSVPDAVNVVALQALGDDGETIRELTEIVSPVTGTVNVFVTVAALLLESLICTDP
jgi:hypothetical protein